MYEDEVAARAREVAQERGSNVTSHYWTGYDEAKKIMGVNNLI